MCALSHKICIQAESVRACVCVCVRNHLAIQSKCKNNHLHVCAHACITVCEKSGTMSVCFLSLFPLCGLCQSWRAIRLHKLTNSQGKHTDTHTHHHVSITSKEVTLSYMHFIETYSNPYLNDLRYGDITPPPTPTRQNDNDGL